MNVILCIDENFGMMFNHRRQSMDCSLLEHLIGYIMNKRLYMNEYSYKMFSDFGLQNIVVDSKFMDMAGTGEFCFVEDVPLIQYEQQVEKLIICKWNRRYPADFYMDISLEDGWEMTDILELEGSSHEKITKETYIRCIN